MGDMRKLSLCERDKHNAKHRIKYRHTRHYIKQTSANGESFTDLINNIISDKMTQEERNLLHRDIEREMNRIEKYHKHVEYPENF